MVTDNGPNYRAAAFVRAVTAFASRHQRIRPYTPRHNGKVERYQRILAEELLYARTWTSETQRAEAIQVWNIHYNYHRAHTAVGDQPPASHLHRRHQRHDREHLVERGGQYLRRGSPPLSRPAPGSSNRATGPYKVFRRASRIDATASASVMPGFCQSRYDVAPRCVSRYTTASTEGLKYTTRCRSAFWTDSIQVAMSSPRTMSL